VKTVLSQVAPTVAVAVDEVPVHVARWPDLETSEGRPGLRQQRHVGELIGEAARPRPLAACAPEQDVDLPGRCPRIDDRRIIDAVAVDVTDSRYAVAQIEVALEHHVGRTLLQEGAHLDVVDVPALERVVRGIPGVEVEANSNSTTARVGDGVLDEVLQV